MKILDQRADVPDKILIDYREYTVKPKVPMAGNYMKSLVNDDIVEGALAGYYYIYVTGHPSYEVGSSSYNNTYGWKRYTYTLTPTLERIYTVLPIPCLDGTYTISKDSTNYLYATITCCGKYSDVEMHWSYNIRF